MKFLCFVTASAIVLAKNHVYQAWSNHIKLWYPKVEELLNSREISLPKGPHIFYPADPSDRSCGGGHAGERRQRGQKISPLILLQERGGGEEREERYEEKSHRREQRLKARLKQRQCTPNKWIQ